MSESISLSNENKSVLDTLKKPWGSYDDVIEMLLEDYKINFKGWSDRDLSKLPHNVLVRIVKAIESSMEDPLLHSQKMKGEYEPPQYKLRVSDYRVIILLDKSNKVLLVDGAGHRSTIYQRYGKG